MTRDELIEMCGSEEDAFFAMEILLKNVKPTFVKSCIEAEITKTVEKINDYKKNGFIYISNETHHVNWNKADDFFTGFKMSEEEKRQYDEARKKCNDAESLLYRKNRLMSLIYR